MTYEKLEEIVGRKAGEACFSDFIGLFDMLGVKAKLVNLYGHIEQDYVPEKINKNVQREIVFLRHDGHCYWVSDSNVKKSLAYRIARVRSTCPHLFMCPPSSQRWKNTFALTGAWVT